MDHAPVVNEETTTADLLAYVKHQTGNPIEREGCTIYHYSSHKPDYTALEARCRRLEDGEYIVPFQVDSAWSYIWTSLPEQLRRNADFLFYHAHNQEYHHYPNYYSFENADLEDELDYKSNIAKEYAKK